MKKKVFWAKGVGISLLLLFSITQNTQSFAQAEKGQTQLQHEVKVTLKLIQVYVTDKKGNPVQDLEREDFIVSDNGKQQKVTEFERHILALPSAKTEPQTELIKETPLPAPRELMNRKFFLFFDFAFNNPRGVVKAREAALHFIDTQLQPSDELGIISYSTIKSLKLHEYLTTDHRKVREFVERFGRWDVYGSAENFETEYWLALAGENPKDASRSGSVFDSKGDPARIAQSRTESRIHVLNFSRKIGELAKALRYVPGHKYVLLFSSGVPYSIIHGVISPGTSPKFENPGESSLSLVYEDMLKELSAANCSIYALSTEDLADGLEKNVQVRGDFSLQKMTSATGGKYFGNINNYEQHIEKIQSLTGCYYVVGYYIDEKWDGDYHKIKVEVNRPGCKVYAQKGYFDPKPFKEYNDLEKMLQLVDLALSENPLFQTPARLPSEALSFSFEGEANLCLISKIQADKFQEVARGKFEILSIIFDEKENIVDLRRGEKVAADLPQEDFYYYSFFSLPPGAYKCRLVIRNLDTGRGAVGSSSLRIEKKRVLGISLFPPLLLSPEKNAVYLRGFVPKPLLEKSGAFSLGDALHFDPAQYSPCLEDSINANSLVPALLRCGIVNIPSPEVTASANLVERSSGRTTPLTLFVLSEDLQEDEKRYLVNIHIPELAAGEYDLNLTALEKTSKSESRATRIIKIK
jgi:VWFA-related protein